MKYFVFLTLCAMAVTASVISEEERAHGDNGWYVPQLNGTFVWIDKEEAKNYLENMQKFEDRLSTNPVTFYLYTKANPKKGQKINASKKSIDASHFNAEKPTRITIHGWTMNKNDFINRGLRKAWLSSGDYNTVTVEWGRARGEYASAVLAVPGVGQKVAALINFLIANYGLNLNTLEIVGHSLGAHVAGYAGKNIASGQAHTIIGLDPAMPLFNYDDPNSRLSSTDAYYVESIQTNGGKLGFLKPIGKGAFYPNGGKSQPGCSLDVSGNCSHRRSIKYYVEAVEKDNFSTIKCSNYKDAVAKSCGSIYSSVRMGAVVNAYMVAGNFYVPVKKAAPYGLDKI